MSRGLGGFSFGGLGGLGGFRETGFRGLGVESHWGVVYFCFQRFKDQFQGLTIEGIRNKSSL